MRKLAFFIVSLVTLFFGFILFKGIFLKVKTEAVLLFSDSKETVGEIVDKSSTSGDHRTGRSYYLTYNFITDEKIAVNKGMEVDRYDWEFAKEHQFIPVIYQKYGDQVFSRPKSWWIGLYGFLSKSSIFYSMFLLMISLIIVNRIGHDKLKTDEYAIVRKRFTWAWGFVFFLIIFLFSITTVKFLLFSSSTKAHVEKLSRSGNELLLEYSYKDGNNIYHKSAINIKDEKNFHALEGKEDSIVIDVIYKKLDPETHYLRKSR